VSIFVSASLTGLNSILSIGTNDGAFTSFSFSEALPLLDAADSIFLVGLASPFELLKIHEIGFAM